MWQKFITLLNLAEHWRRIDQDCQHAAVSINDRKMILVLLVVTVAIVLPSYFQVFVPVDFSNYPEYAELLQLASWVTAIVVSYVLLPVLVIRFIYGESLAEYYLGMRGLWRKLPVYLLVYLLFVPAIWLASTTAAFKATYPFYNYLHRSVFDLLAWEFLYALHFIAVEFLFRGFMLRGLSHWLGYRAIFIMLLPYTLIHVGKPFAEVIGAMFAAVILGTLAMRTRMIWGGVVIHISVALSMDLLAVQYCRPGLPCH